MTSLKIRGAALRRHIKAYTRGGTAVVLSAVLLLILVPGASADMGGGKSETVYAVLGNDGAYAGATVVNCFAQGGKITDYGAYNSVENLVGAETPVIEGDTIIWNTASSDTPFYYQGETDTPLPLRFGIRYFLDGREVPAQDVAGAAGELTIEMTVKNETGTGEVYESVDRELLTPFAVQVSLSLDNTMYSVVSLPDNASSVTVGSTITVSYSSFPLPEDTFSFTLQGKDMALEPISIIAIPKAPPGLDSYADFIDVDGMTEGADEMISGADDMESGVGELLDALHEMRDAAKELRDGLNKLADGADDLSGGADAIYSNVRTLKTKAAEFYAGVTEFTTNLGAFDAGMALLQQSIADMAQDISDLNDAVALVSSGATGIHGGIGGISEYNDALATLAAALAATYPTDPNAAALAGGLSVQQANINTLEGNADDLRLLAAGVSANMDTFYTEFSTTFAGSVTALRQSSALLYAASLDLLDGAYQISSGCASLSNALGSLSGGADDLADGAAEAAAGIPALMDALDEMISGVEEMRDGMAELSEDGLQEFKSTLDGLDEFLAALADKAKSYTSFMDTRNIGTVQFVLKTEGIAKAE